MRSVRFIPLLLLSPAIYAGSLACSPQEGASEAAGIGGAGGASAGESLAELRGDHAPVFGGVMKAVAEGNSDVRLSWSPGFDEETSTEQLVYLIYVGKNDLPVAIDRPFATSSPGASSHLLTGLSPQTYRFVVRVIDRDLNMDDNRHSVSVELGDTQAPLFAGVTGAVASSKTELLVEWKSASDNMTPSEQIEYSIWVADSEDGVFQGKGIRAVPGSTSQKLTHAESTSSIWVGVRATDHSGNTDKNKRVISVRAPESEAPVFAGLSSVKVQGTTATLLWSPATDNVTATDGLSYRIHVATESGDYDLLRPSAITAPGASSYTLSGLEPETRYYFLVQAQDQAQNRDKNQIERTVVTGSADEAPPDFAGLESISADTPRSATLVWAPASDDRTLSEDLVYRVSWGNKAGKPQSSLTTAPGRSSAVVLGLEPETTYFATVQAIDAAGNVDENSVELSATTGKLEKDEDAPKLLGGLSVVQVPSRADWLEVNWSGATDNENAADGLRGHVCVAPDASGCEGDKFWSHLNISSEFGSSGAFVSALVPRTSYFVSVRLEDRNGNLMREGDLKLGHTATSYLKNVAPLIDSRCNQCHNYDYGGLINVNSGYSGLSLINPDSAIDSYLIRSLREPGDTNLPFSSESPADHEEKRMPSDGTDYLNGEQEDILLDWLGQGAFNN